MKTIYLFLLCSIALVFTAKSQTTLQPKSARSDLDQKIYMNAYVMYASGYHLENLNSLKKSIDKLYRNAKSMSEKKRSKASTVKSYNKKIDSYLDDFILLQSKQNLLLEELDSLTKLFTKVGVVLDDEQPLTITLNNLKKIRDVSEEILVVFSKLVELFPQESEETEEVPTMLTLQYRRVFFCSKPWRMFELFW